MKTYRILIFKLLILFFTNYSSAQKKKGIYGFKCYNPQYSGPLFKAIRSSTNEALIKYSGKETDFQKLIEKLSSNEHIYLCELYDQNKEFPSFINTDTSTMYRLKKDMNGELYIETSAKEYQHKGKLTLSRRSNVRGLSFDIGIELLENAFTPLFAKILSIEWTDQDRLQIGISNYSKNLCSVFNNERQQLYFDYNLSTLKIETQTLKDTTYVKMKSNNNIHETKYYTRNKSKKQGTILIGDPNKGHNGIPHRIKYIKLENM